MNNKVRNTELYASDLCGGKWRNSRAR